MTQIRLNCCQKEEQDTLCTVAADGSLRASDVNIFFYISVLIQVCLRLIFNVLQSASQFQKNYFIFKISDFFFKYA